MPATHDQVFCHAVGVIADYGASLSRPTLILCARKEILVNAWQQAWKAASHTEKNVSSTSDIQIHHGSPLDTEAHAIVSPANSYGWMRGGIDLLYAQAFPDLEPQIRSAILAYHGGELPVGEAIIVPTEQTQPAWLISAPTMREPGEQLAEDTINPYLAARAVFTLWCNGKTEEGQPIREVITSIAMPGLGTGYGGVPVHACARQVFAAWEEVFAVAEHNG